MAAFFDREPFMKKLYIYLSVYAIIYFFLTLLSYAESIDDILNNNNSDEKILFNYVTKTLKINLIPSKQSKLRKTYVKKTSDGWKLFIGNKPYFVKGFCYSPVPVGKGVDWVEKGIYHDKHRNKILYTDFALMKMANANTARIYSTWPAKWLNRLYKRFKIKFILTLWMGHYGINLNGKYIKKVDYGNIEHRKAIIKEIVETVLKYRNSPAVLIYGLGNENNYVFNWEVESLGAFVASKKHLTIARNFYSLVNIAAKIIHKLDPYHPVMLGNGDLQYIDIIAKECPDIDIMGANVYRGKGFGPLFEDVKNYLHKPFLFTELGCDALNAVSNEEEPETQAEYIKNQWIEIYNNAAPNGFANCIGGTHFEFLDEWWKSNEKDKSSWYVHDKHSSWPSEGYLFDNAAGNNMSEEWFGVLKQTKKVLSGVNERIARPAFFILKNLWQTNPY